MRASEKGRLAAEVGDRWVDFEVAQDDAGLRFKLSHYALKPPRGIPCITRR